jgi:hypothetical protein
MITRAGYIPVFVMCLLIGLQTSTRADETMNADPSAVKIVTSDIDNFWHAFDDAQKSNDPARVFGIEYLVPGSPGVWGFVPGRIKSPQNLAKTVQKYRAYYVSARGNMETISSARPRIIADLRRFKQIDPDATFPNVYFVVGVLNSGGTSVSDVGLVLGAEMHAKPADMSAIAMPGFNTKVLSDASTVAPLVAHELTHYNQHDTDEGRLSDAVLNEGTADFMSQLVDGDNVNTDQWAFGCAHEAELWTLFTRTSSSTDDAVRTSWLYRFDPGPLGAPPFIGYWLGSRVAQAYYDSHADKRAAVHAILNISDPAAFIAESGYDGHPATCTPEARMPDRLGAT